MKPVSIVGVVTAGRQVGRELGFPTANLEVNEDFGLADGVYRARAYVNNIAYDAMANLGCNPTVGHTQRHLETHLFGFEGDLYGSELRVELLEKIRDERRFDSVEALREQIEKDKNTILKTNRK